jgi:hypothetical protein
MPVRACGESGAFHRQLLLEGLPALPVRGNWGNYAGAMGWGAFRALGAGAVRMRSKGNAP